MPTDTSTADETPPIGAPSVGERMVHLLGQFRVTEGGRPVPLPSGTHRLIAFLALQGHPVERGYASSCLWLDKTDDRAAANLRSTLWRLRRGVLPLVETTASHVGLAAGVVVDALAGSVAMRRLVDDGADVDLDAVEVSDLAVDLLPSWYDDFVELERERFRQMRLHALEALARRLALAGRHARALDAALTAVAADPLRESAHRAVILIHLEEGNTGEAVRQYRTLADILRRQLGILPSERSHQLVAGQLPARRAAPGQGGAPIPGRPAGPARPAGSAGSAGRPGSAGGSAGSARTPSTIDLRSPRRIAVATPA